MNSLLHLLAVIVVAAIVYYIAKLILVGVALQLAGLAILIVAVVIGFRLVLGDRTPL